jgi:lipopolysaccharide export system protein LptC
MTQAEISASTRVRPTIQHWRRRSRLIRTLRVAFPAFISVILLAMVGLSLQSALRRPARPGPSDAPIRATHPHFLGRNGRGQPFVLTADTATRDPQSYQRVMLQNPALVVDPEGVAPTRIRAGAGVYHEDTGKLELSQGVRMSKPDGVVDTDASLFDTKTNELVGSRPVQGVLSQGCKRSPMESMTTASAWSSPAGFTPAYRPSSPREPVSAQPTLARSMGGLSSGEHRKTRWG